MSAPDPVHLAGALARPGLRKAVVCRFVLKGMADEGKDISVFLPLPQRGLEVRFPFGKQAPPQMAIGRQAQAVAALAEMVAQGANKTNFSFGSLKGISFSRAI